MPEIKKSTNYWWLFLLGLCAVPCLSPFKCARDPEAVVGRIPITSELSELDQFLARGNDDSGNVVEWIPAGKFPESHLKPVTNEFGTFIPKSLGDYDQ